MSSDDSRTTTSSSRLSQFGLYRSIDARTEEFLRLSRKRQIRQGCACAAVSTAITVTVVVVILLIYEYAIAVESGLVQTKKTYTERNETKDNPVADRLDRSYFGFDQDYFEKMPLLVNAMQENSYVDPNLDTATIKSKARYIITNYSRPTSTTARFTSHSIRRTSPRPFYFEYKSPTPTPFSKTYGSRSWVDNYRNTQRLKNLQQVIKYLEKTINAKFGDIYALPTSTIAFSGLYVEPAGKDGNLPNPTTPTPDLLMEESKKVETYKSNHLSDPLYSFKPDSPGDVNLLADGFFRFSPLPTPSLIKERTSIPMFRPIRKRHCLGKICIQEAESKIVNSQESGDIRQVEPTSNDKLKSFSVMLNLFPLKPTSVDSMNREITETTPTPISKIYITTSRPTIHFKRRSTTPIRRTATRFKRPRLLPTKKLTKTVDVRSEGEHVVEPKMIVHVNVYSTPEMKGPITTESHTTTTQTLPTKYTTPMPMLTSTQVEDYHVGSSGIIPVENRPLLTPAPPPPIPSIIPTLPTATTGMPFIDMATSSTETVFRSTSPPDIIKFSHEDAKVPDQYKKLLNIEDPTTTTPKTTSTQPEISRRNSEEMSMEHQEDYDVEARTLVVKLRNDISTTTEATPRSKISNYNNQESTTYKTYVPQINGHYRSINQNSRNINSWLSDTPSDRKKRLEMSVAGFRKSTYVPQYVEIKRNNTRNLSDDNKDYETDSEENN